MAATRKDVDRYTLNINQAVKGDDATKMIGEGKYYEANLALKAAEDSVVIETYAIDAVPQRKGKS